MNANETTPEQESVSSSLSFTGERMMPGQVEVDLYQEHLARYIFAEQLARGKQVLDAGCGVGYGSQRLARVAAVVTGIDNATEAIEYARANYAAPNLVLTVGDVTALPFTEPAFDLAVSFELIEHLAEPQFFLRELARVLKPDGLVLISTPNRRTYSDARPGYTNPFHVREYYAAEFAALLREVFPVVRLLCQNYSPVQTFSDEETDGSKSEEFHLVCEPGLKTDQEQAQFFVAICGFHHEAVLQARQSKPVVLAGTGNIIPEKDRWIQGLQEQVSARDATIRKLQEEFESRTDWAKRSSDEVAARDATIHALQSELESKTEWAKRSVQELANRDATVRDLENQLETRSNPDDLSS